MHLPDAIPRNVRELVEFLRAVAERLDHDRCLQIAGSLTYTTLLSLVPLITVALSLITAFPVFAEWTGQLDELMVENVLPEAIGNAVTSYLAQFSEKAARLTAVGIVVLAATALMLMLTIDRAFNQIFRVSRARPIVQRVLMYWAVLTLGPVLIGASISMTSYLVTASLGLAKGAATLLGEELLRLAPFLLTAAATTLLYLVVPNRRVRLRHALVGGVIAGLLFELMKRGFALYVAKIPTYTLVYGTFAVIPIFLLWLYLSWLVVIAGAMITAILPGYRHMQARRRAPGRRFLEALDLLGRLVAGQRSGKVKPLLAVANEVRLAPDSCERLLERMAELGWTARTVGDGWVLTRDAAEITVADVHRAFVFDPDAGGELAERLGATRLVEAHRAAAAGALEISLADFFAGATPPPATVKPLHARAQEK